MILTAGIKQSDIFWFGFLGVGLFGVLFCQITFLPFKKGHFYKHDYFPLSFMELNGKGSFRCT